MEKKYYTNERNVQIVISLLKAHGIKRVIVSPGTTNMTFVGSIQHDPWFEVFSSVDERSAAYIACGMAEETGEPVVISCTGATASRNYMPGLTEAYYRKLPVLAITSHSGEDTIGHLDDQVIDRRSIPNDVAMESVTIPFCHSSRDEHFCMIEGNKAILALKQNGGGPSHINMYTGYSRDFSVKELPKVRSICRYTLSNKLPDLPKVGKIGVFIGSHHNFTPEETIALDRFCESNNAVVFCDHTSGYLGNYGVHFHLICGQKNYASSLAKPDLLIHIGEVSGIYKVKASEVWRVSEDGALRDTFGALTKVFMMKETQFFEHYYHEGVKNTQYYKACVAECTKAIESLPDLPFGNVWIAKNCIGKLPEGCELHMGIYNSFRSWNFFPLPPNVKGKCNVGGFGIDGALSTLVGASLVNPKKLYFGVFGDLAFFYDMNVLGNRHVGNNVRIMLINNSRGTEFRLYGHPCSEFGDAADPYMAAAGHYGNQSKILVKGYAEALGYQYLTASDKDSFMQAIEIFMTPIITDKPMVFEVFTDSTEESKALELIQNSMTDLRQQMKHKAVEIAGNLFGNKGIGIIKKIVKR